MKNGVTCLECHLGLSYQGIHLTMLITSLTNSQINPCELMAGTISAQMRNSLYFASLGAPTKWILKVRMFDGELFLLWFSISVGISLYLQIS